jgi:hypothetical protein
MKLFITLLVHVNKSLTSAVRDILICCAAEPHFLIEPQNQTVDQGHMVTFDCTASGQPHPEMYWWKETTPIESKGRIFIMPNNSLR